MRSIKCWAWEYFRTSVASKAIFFRRGAAPAATPLFAAMAAPAVEKPIVDTN
jgi:hypothetical protein